MTAEQTNNKETEILSNLRLELEQVIEILRHLNLSHLGIMTILVPITTAGFAIKVDGNEVLVFLAGVFSILIWIIFIFITIKYIYNEVEETRKYGIYLCSELKLKTDQEKDNYMRLMNIAQPAKFHYSHFQFIFGGCIIFGWIIYFFVKFS